MPHTAHANMWLDRAPAPVAAATAELMERIAALRASETIYPPQERILNALATTPPQDVRVVILGQDPYHEPGQAMGLAFSVPNGTKLPPSLRNIYKELAADLDVPAPVNGDLTSWARQGVLLLNTSLTVRKGAAGSHAKLGWRTLADYVVGECFRLPQPIVFLAWGKPAITLVESQAAYVGLAANKCIIASTHPSPLSASRAAKDAPAFLGSRPFSQANAFLIEHGEKPIDWACVG